MVLWAVLGSLRPSVVGGAWVALGAGTEWMPVRVLVVVTGGLLAVTVARVMRAADHHRIVVLVRTVIRLANDLEMQSALRRVK